jgi:alcohol dehydrogenase
MDALLFDGRLRLDNHYLEPQLRPAEALIRPHLVGICNTDIEITRGYMGFHGVLGHEFVGTVVACEDAAWVGRRVVGEINAACGRCAMCLRGDASHCPERTTLGIDRRDGAMAELFSLPIACLHSVPETIPDEAAVFTEPLAAALEILEHIHIRPTDRVAVVGDGKLGLLCALTLRLPGCDVVIVGRHPERWEMLREQGITATTTDDRRPTTDDESNLSSFVLRPSSFDIVVDCTGNPKGFTTACALVRPRGKLVLKSTFAADAPINLSMLVVDEIQLLGSRCGPFAPALRLMERGLVSPQSMIAARYPLRDGLTAFRAAHGQLKVLLEV